MIKNPNNKKQIRRLKALKRLEIALEEHNKKWNYTPVSVFDNKGYHLKYHIEILKDRLGIL